MATVEYVGQMIAVHGTGYGESGANGRCEPLRLYALCFALLTCLFPLSQASAQPAQGVPSDFSGLGGARESSSPMTQARRRKGVCCASPRTH